MKVRASSLRNKSEPQFDELNIFEMCVGGLKCFRATCINQVEESSYTLRAGNRHLILNGLLSGHWFRGVSGYLMPPVQVTESCFWNVVWSFSDKFFI